MHEGSPIATRAASHRYALRHVVRMSLVPGDQGTGISLPTTPVFTSARDPSGKSRASSVVYSSSNVRRCARVFHPAVPRAMPCHACYVGIHMQAEKTQIIMITAGACGPPLTQ
jgi:hypothetical protein